MDRRSFGLMVGASVVGWALEASAGPKKGLGSSLLRQGTALTAAQKAQLLKGPVTLTAPMRLSARRTYAGAARLTTQLVDKLDTQNDVIVLGSLLFKEVRWPTIAVSFKPAVAGKPVLIDVYVTATSSTNTELKIGTGNGWALQTFARSEPGHMVAIVTPSDTGEQTYTITLTHAEPARKTIDIKYIEVTPTR